MNQELWVRRQPFSLGCCLVVSFLSRISSSPWKHCRFLKNALDITALPLPAIEPKSCLQRALSIVKDNLCGWDESSLWEALQDSPLQNHQVQDSVLFPSAVTVLNTINTHYIPIPIYSMSNAAYQKY